MKKILVPSKNQLHLISHNDIILCQSENCYTTIFINSGEMFVVCRSLTNVAKELDSQAFVRVSQSNLINKSYIKSVDKKKKLIKLTDERHIAFTTTLKDLIGLIA